MREKTVLFIKNNFLLIVCISVASFFRLIFLDRIPVAITGDELFYLLTAKLSLFSKFAWNPVLSLFFLYPQHQSIQAELPYFLTPYYWSSTPFSLLTAHIPTAICSILSVLFIYLISKELCNKNIALLTGFIAAVNPWFIVIGRTFYEMNAALLFFLITWYVVIKAKEWMILWIIPFFFLSFYSYIGTKIIAFPFLILIIGYAYFFIHKRKFFSQYMVVLGICFAFLVFYTAMLLLHPTTSRLGEIITPSNPVFNASVNELRKTTMHYSFIALFENKFIIFLFALIAKVFATLSFDYLFLNGDLFFAQGHGLFYAIDVCFLLIGIVSMFRKNMRLATLLAVLSIISLVPQVIHDITIKPFTPHIMLLFPFFILFISNGIYTTVIVWKDQKKIIFASVLIGLVYMFFVGNFFTTYLFKSPLATNTDFTSRAVSRYISLASQTKQVIVYSQSGGDLYRKYLFYANAVTSTNADLVINNLSSGNLTIGNVKFLGCERKLPLKSGNLVIVYSDECGGNPLPHGLQIAQLADGGGEYTIIHDTVCEGASIPPYPMNLSLNDFIVETLPQQTFCEKFVSSY